MDQWPRRYSLTNSITNGTKEYSMDLGGETLGDATVLHPDYASHCWSHNFSPGPRHPLQNMNVMQSVKCINWDLSSLVSELIVSTLSFGLKLWQITNHFPKYLERNARALTDASHSLLSIKSAAMWSHAHSQCHLAFCSSPKITQLSIPKVKLIKTFLLSLCPSCNQKS